LPRREQGAAAVKVQAMREASCNEESESDFFNSFGFEAYSFLKMIC
jgi:hypothetical protein